MIKSGNLLPYRMDDISLPLENAKKLNLNTFNVPIMVEVPDPNSTTMVVTRETIRQVGEAIEKIQRAGYDLMLEPFPWIKGGELAETDWRPSRPGEWFVNWRKVINQAVDVALECGVSKLIISDGIVHMEPYSDQWIQLIKEIRSRFPGQITYRTGWWYTAQWNPFSLSSYRRKLHNPLFGYLDFISISAYFELTGKTNCSREQLTRAWYSSPRYAREQPIFDQIKAFYTTWQKPIYFGEVGYVDRAGSNNQPWNVIPSEVVDPEEQKNCFEAFFRVFWRRPWVLGASIFQIHDPQSNYYPVGKPAEKVIAAVMP